MLKVIAAKISVLALTLVAAVVTSTASLATICSTGPFIVFFDFDSDELLPSQNATLDNAFSLLGNCGYDGIYLAGHTDQSGPASYNVQLAERRIQTVMAYFARRGVVKGKFLTEAFGETRPFSSGKKYRGPTYDRRVEIAFGPDPTDEN